MFARVFALLPLVALVVADQCNTGSNYCCQTYGSSNTPSIQQEIQALSAAGLIGNIIGSISGNVGLHCTDIIGGSDCKQQPVCCENNHFNGLVNVGCSPVNLNA